MLSPIIAMLHNTGQNRWHPVVFVESPLPGPPADDKPVRHKSKMHHTAGFATREEAASNIVTDLIPRVKEHAVGEVKTALSKDLTWDGEGIPAMVAFFAEQDGELVAVL